MNDLTTEQPQQNGLKRFAGGWSKEELADFEEAIAIFEQLDGHFASMRRVAARMLEPEA